MGEKREKGKMGTSVEFLFPSLPSSPLSFINPRNRVRFWTANNTAICTTICTVPCKRFAQVENWSIPKFVRTRVNGVEETREVSRAAFARDSFFPYYFLPTFSSSDCFFSRASLASRFHAGSFGGSLGREGGCLIVSYKKYSRLRLPQKSEGWRCTRVMRSQGWGLTCSSFFFSFMGQPKTFFRKIPLQRSKYCLEI